jgi:hypothetical protein
MTRKGIIIFAGTIVTFDYNEFLMKRDTGKRDTKTNKLMYHRTREGTLGESFCQCEDIQVTGQGYSSQGDWMKGQNFSLKPFESTDLSRQSAISGFISLSSGTLAISYTCIGPLTELVIPEPAGMPTRKDGLWEETCFEFFLAVINHDRYWEFNLSPAGDWNVYCFKLYRQGMQAEPAFASFPFSVQRRPDALHISLEFDLTRVIPVSDQTVEAGISAVIKPVSGEISYWALTHPGIKADFHKRDSFTIKLNS